MKQQKKNLNTNIKTLRSFTMNKYSVLSLALLCVVNTSINAMQEELDESTVPNSSYFVYEGSTGTTGGVPMTSKLVTFYTFDGKPIKTIEHKFRFPVIERKLDRNAPKPRPTEYEVKYWPAIQLPFGMRKGAPGNFILFYDKNGNIINRFRYDDGSTVQTFSSSLDLSAVKQKLVEEAKK